MAGWLIYLLLPCAGLGLYLFLLRSRWREDRALTQWYLVIFFFYGGLLTVLLTALFWVWSGMASLGTFLLLAGVPVFPCFAWRMRAFASGPTMDHTVLFGLLIGYAPAVGLLLVLGSLS